MGHLSLNTLAYNTAATQPHQNLERPVKVKLTQTKKIVASGMSEAEAIERAKAGDAESFEGLYGLHKRRVYSLCLRMTGNTAEAEDLTQEAFLQLYRKIATFRGESAFSTWLHRLAVNVVLMHLRKKGLPYVQLGGAVRFVPQEIKDYLVTNRGLTAHRLWQVVRKGAVK